MLLFVYMQRKNRNSCHTRTTSYDVREVDKHIVAEITNIFHDEPSKSSDYRKGKLISFNKTRKWKFEATAIYKYYVDFTSFDISEQDGFIYVYVNPLTLDEPVGTVDSRTYDKKEKGWYLAPNSFDDDLNEYTKPGGLLSQKLSEDARGKIDTARDKAEKSVKNIMISTFFPHLGIKEKDPNKIIVKFERRKSNNIRKLEMKD